MVLLLQHAPQYSRFLGWHPAVAVATGIAIAWGVADVGHAAIAAGLALADA